MPAPAFIIPTPKPRTAYDGTLNEQYFSSDTNASSFTFSGISHINQGVHLVIGVMSNQTANRTISSVTVALDGGSPITCTQLVQASTTTTPCGIFIVDVSSCTSTFDIVVTFDNTVRGCALYVNEFSAFEGGGVASYTEVVTGTSPLTTASRTQTRNEVLIAIGTHRGGGDIDYDYDGTSGGWNEGVDIVYQTRAGMGMNHSPNAGGWREITSTVSFTWSGGTLPILVVAYIT